VARTQKPQDKALTVVVFRDRLSARSFQVSLNWLTRLGWSAFVFVLVLSLVTLVALRFYVRSRSLDAEIYQLRQNSIAESTRETPRSIPPVATTSGSAGVAVQDGSLLFRDLSPQIHFRESSRIQVDEVSLRYQGAFLNLRFNLRYTLNDGGRQQGHFLILARGPETLMSYPDGTLNLASDRYLIAPDRGEYFSVGKFREVEASLPAPRKKSTFKEVQVLIFDEENQLIRLHRIAVQNEGSVLRAPPPPAAPSEQSDSTSEESSNE